MNFKKRSCSRNYYDNYIPPYERLLRRNRSWKPKKVKLEEELQEECRKGNLTPFQQPENFSCFFIHKHTNLFTIDELIDEAKNLKHFTIDTENDVFSHQPATLQVEFIKPNSPTIVIIIEVQYLPPQTSPLFFKIKQLCSIIFTSNNRIYSWGSALTELKKFERFNLFNTKIQITDENIQDDYYDGIALQMAIKFTFDQYLNKIATLAEWGCGIDLNLGTYVPEQVTGSERVYRMGEEKKYRSILTEYAINDVFAVTKLVYKLNLMNVLTPPPTVEYEQISDDEEESMQLQQEQSIELEPLSGELNVHDRDEQPTLNEIEFNYNQYPNHEEQGEKISIEIEITPSDNNLGIFDFEDISDDDQDGIYDNESRQVHTEDEPIELQLYDNQPLLDERKMSLYDEEIELISDDEIDNQTLPDIMKIHRPFKELHQHQHQQHHSNETRRVHDKDEPHKVRNSYYLGPQLYLKRNPTPNQIINRRHRANRYRHEVIRDVYQAFKITDIKEILRAINIRYVNINIRHHTLYIGLKNEQAVDQVEQLLHSHMFTESHYHHYMKKKKKNQSVRN